MPKLRVFSGREVCKLLRQHGFQKIRQKGSHIIMQKRAGNSTTLGIVRQSGLPRSLFESK